MGVSVTVENLDPMVLDQLHSEAQRQGIDVSTLIKRMIRDELKPVEAPDSVRMHHDLDALAGTWSAQDAEEFVSATAPFRQCDGELWK